MAERVFFKPADGIALPDPLTGGYFPAEGAWTERTTYIERRLRDGSGTLIQKPDPGAAKAEAPPLQSIGETRKDGAAAEPEPQARAPSRMRSPFARRDTRTPSAHPSSVASPSEATPSPQGEKA